VSLAEYHAKRQFDRTPEPVGESGPTASEPLRFVVQKHAASHLHYDFRLEAGGVLKSWAIPKGPSVNPHDKHLAMMTEDHPLEYRTFEGTIPKGSYGAGTVMVWDEGTYEPLDATGNREADDKLARQGIHQEHLTFILHGQKLNGEFALIKMKQADEDNAWLLIKADKDEYARAIDITKQDRSAITNRSLEEIAHHAPVTKLHTNLSGTPKSTLPAAPKPMLASLGEQPFDDPNWRYEIKWDGYRILARVEASGRVQLISRGSQDYTGHFQPIATELRQLHVPALLDGEVVVVDEAGRSRFQMLQNYLRTGTGRLVYYAFDLLHFDGHDLTGLPLYRRQELLRRVLPQGGYLRLSEQVTEHGQALFEQAVAAGLEGIMAKRADSLYQPGTRSRDWLKLKTRRRQEAVIIGYTTPRGGRQYFGALVLGIYQDGQLIYAGHTGTGFDDTSLQDLHQRMQSLRTNHSPIQPEPKTNEPATWIRPELVAEIAFTEWTDDGQMRHPVFLGLRADKRPQEVIRETPTQNPAGEGTNADARPSSRRDRNIGSESPAHEAERKRSLNRDENLAQQSTKDSITLKLNHHTIRFAHPGKIFWPKEGITKGQLLEYYRDIAPTILPYLKDRPESLNRFPGGITGESFYQKNIGPQVPSWLKTTTIHSDSTEADIRYLLAQDEATLAYMINLGCIELNPWSSRVKHLDRPDWCIIDLDPEAVSFEAVIATAQAVHAVLDELKIPSYPKTSGATGLHIYIPLGAQYSYDQAKLFAELIVRLTHSRLPKITSIERSPKKRQGKVYLDYLQNRHGQTLAAPYSVRPRPDATVSTPLHWDEVTDGLSPAQFTIHNTHDRLAQHGDLWQPVLGPGIDLEQVLSHLQSQH